MERELSAILFVFSILLLVPTYRCKLYLCTQYVHDVAEQHQQSSPGPEQISEPDNTNNRQQQLHQIKSACSEGACARA